MWVGLAVGAGLCFLRFFATGLQFSTTASSDPKFDWFV